MGPVLLKIPQVMERLAMGQTKLYELMASGALPSVKVGRSRRIRSDELESFIEELDRERPNQHLHESVRNRSTALSS